VCSTLTTKMVGQDSYSYSGLDGCAVIFGTVKRGPEFPPLCTDVVAHQMLVYQFHVIRYGTMSNPLVDI